MDNLARKEKNIAANIGRYLDNWVAVYVPIDAHENKDTVSPADTATTLESVQFRMASAFGGFTQYGALGGWVDDDGNLVVERVAVVKAFHYGSQADAYAIAGSIAAYVGRKLDQDCVAVETSEGMTFI